MRSEESRLVGIYRVLLLTRGHQYEVAGKGAVGDDRFGLRAYGKFVLLSAARNFHLLELLELEVLQERALVDGETAFEKVVIAVAYAGLSNDSIFEGVSPGVDLV